MSHPVTLYSMDGYFSMKKDNFLEINVFTSNHGTFWNVWFRKGPYQGKIWPWFRPYNADKNLCDQANYYNFRSTPFEGDNQSIHLIDQELENFRHLIIQLQFKKL